MRASPAQKTTVTIGCFSFAVVAGLGLSIVIGIPTLIIKALL